MGAHATGTAAPRPGRALRRIRVGLGGLGELVAFFWAALKATLELFLGSRKPLG